MSRRFIRVYTAVLGLAVGTPYAMSQSPSKQLPTPGKTPPVPGKSLPTPGLPDLSKPPERPNLKPLPPEVPTLKPLNL